MYVINENVVPVFFFTRVCNEGTHMIPSEIVHMHPYNYPANSIASSTWFCFILGSYQTEKAHDTQLFVPSYRRTWMTCEDMNNVRKLQTRSTIFVPLTKYVGHWSNWDVSQLLTHWSRDKMAVICRRHFLINSFMNIAVFRFNLTDICS